MNNCQLKDVEENNYFIYSDKLFQKIKAKKRSVSHPFDINCKQEYPPVSIRVSKQGYLIPETEVINVGNQDFKETLNIYEQLRTT